jgi:CubicO group peptidase (beta-lactamase class C family)
MGESGDFAAYAASLELVDPPGSAFDYSSGTSIVLARILGEAVGSGPEDTRAFMDRELFDRIGMAPVETEFDAAGTWVAGWEAKARRAASLSSGCCIPAAGPGTARKFFPRTG